MTSSAKQTDGRRGAAATGQDGAIASRRAPVRRPGTGLVALAALVLGWGFILAQHRLEVTVPMVVLSLGWLALVFGAWCLVRAAQGAPDDDDDDDAWFLPTGKLGELQLEKQSLLKALKEIEFDQQLGKMSDADALAMARMYRGRAIEVIKAIDALEGRGAASGDAAGWGVRAEIERELRARLEIEAKGRLKGKAKAQAAKKKAAAGAAAPAEGTAEQAPEPTSAAGDARDELASGTTDGVDAEETVASR